MLRGMMALSRRRFLALLWIAPAVATTPTPHGSLGDVLDQRFSEIVNGEYATAWTMAYWCEGNHYIPVSGLNLTPWKVESTS